MANEAEAEAEIQQRKADHIAIAASGEADFRERSTLLSCVHLRHNSLPELSWEQIDLSTQLLGKTLSAPIIISGMTGGTAEAQAINRDLALAAQELGLALGVGSQRAMAEDTALAATYQVRDVAPDILLIGNIGVVQAKQYGVERVAELVTAIGADAMAVHLNPAQEMIQRQGDRDFRGSLACIRALQRGLPVPVIVKETGCGISLPVARALASTGIEYVDVSGAGGTSWVAVERHRAQAESAEQELGDEYWDWGLPTAVSVRACTMAGLQVVASGGIRTGLDIARAIALGATAGGLAAPLLRAQRRGGVAAVVETLSRLISSLRTAHLLTGSKTPAKLADKRIAHLAEPLRSWLDDLE